MPIATQLALSIELTKVIKLARSLPSIVEKVFELARSLQCSGSDLVTEEDLLEIFGRSKIDHALATSFRTVVSPSDPSSICEQIFLDNGPGPTVRRALSPGQDAYFATVVQCSLLASTLKMDSLAAILRTVLENQSAATMQTTDGNKTVPSEEHIKGFLRTCQEQTASYPWRNHILAVAAQLGIAEEDVFGKIPQIILSGFATSLSVVQSLREDRIIHADIGSTDGVALLVVWARHALGLTVTVHTYWNDHRTTTTFGDGTAQVEIDVRSVVDNKLRSASFTLLEASSDGSKEEMITIVEDEDAFPISGVTRIPAKNYGKAVLERITIDVELEQQTVVGEMVQLTCALAIILSKRVAMVHNDFQKWAPNFQQDDHDADIGIEDCFSDDVNHVNVDSPYTLSRIRIIQAMKFLFGPKATDSSKIDDYIIMFSRRQLDHATEVPRCIQIIFKENDSMFSLKEIWHRLVDAAKFLCLLILAFAHVDDLEHVADLPLLKNVELLCELPIAQELRAWKGDEILPIKATSWFSILTRLLLEDYDAAASMNPGASLVSDRGWSIYLASFLQSKNHAMSKAQDPAFVEPGQFQIRRGVPCRNEVRKHFIVDGPDKGHLQNFEWQVEDAAGDETTLRCASMVTNGRPYYGERQDSFTVTLRLIHTDHGSDYTRRTGYLEFFESVWQVRRTESCDHDTRRDNKLTLQPGYVTLSGFGDEEQFDGYSSDDHSDSGDPQVRICLTAHNTTARWRALIAILNARLQGPKNRRFVLLRGSDCCFQCAIDQIAHSSNKWFIVL